MERFVVVINEHRKLGLVMLPYVVRKNGEGEFYETEDLITEEKFADYKPELNDAEQSVCKLIFEYEDQKLARLFSKKKLPSKVFIDSLPDELFEQQVRPFIERKIAACAKIISEKSLTLYYKEGTANLYPSDRIASSAAISTAKFFFMKATDGLKYTLSVINADRQVSLLDKPGFILVNDPCVAVVDNVMYRFEDIDGKKLKPFFLRDYINIPEKFERRYFETFIFNAIKNYDVEVSGFGYVELRRRPKVKLLLTADLRHEAVFLPLFLYGKREINLSAKSSYFVDMAEKGGEYTYTKIFRDIDYEFEIRSLLEANGLERYDDSFYRPLSAVTEIDLMSWLSKNRSLLESHSIVHEVSGGKKLRLDVPVMDVSLREENDWFNVNAHLVVGEHKIPFSVIRKYILHKERCFELPDGTLVIIPLEWFAEYKDLALWSKVKGESVKLKRVHFNAIDHSASLGRNALKRLSGFRDYASFKAIVPDGIQAELRSYQKEGFNWLCFMYHNDFGACLADDMGLGKTLQTLALLQRIKEDNAKSVPAQPSGQLSLFDDVSQDVDLHRAWKPSIVVVPSSLVFNWSNEARKFAPQLRLLKYVGGERHQYAEQFDKYDIVLTTYGVLRNDIDMLEKKEFVYAVLDESQIIKNPESKSFKAVNRINSSHRMVITGTPIENSLMDLWSQMHFLNTDMFGSQREFKRVYSNADELESLKRIITPFVLRREKENVLSDLPDLNEQIVYCNMAPGQESMYEEEISKLRNLYMEAKEDGTVKSVSFKILQGLTRLRQLANHPLLCNPDCDADSGKFDEICRSIESVLAHGHKVLIFSSFVKHLDIVEAYLSEQSVGFCKLIGSMPAKQRQAQVELFQTTDSKRVFLISLKAGGVGLNLTAADYVFILDPWWNPASENQAVARAHRMGQQNKVFVYRYISQNTIEEKIKLLQDKKQALVNELIGADNEVAFNEELIEELLIG